MSQGRSRGGGKPLLAVHARQLLRGWNKLPDQPWHIKIFKAPHCGLRLPALKMGE
jgi:hypothetical protein